MHSPRLQISSLFTSVVFMSLKFIYYSVLLRDPFVTPVAALVQCFGYRTEKFVVCVEVVILKINPSPESP